MVIEPDGEILVAGRARSDFAMVLYHADGTLDTNFGNGGLIATGFAGGTASATGLVVAPDGEIYAAGVDTTVSGKEFALAAYLGGGTLDSNFGVGGQVTTAVPNGLSQFSGAALAIQPDGNLVVGGSYKDGTAGDFAADLVVRYLGATEKQVGGNGDGSGSGGSTTGGTSGGGSSAAGTSGGGDTSGGVRPPPTNTGTAALDPPTIVATSIVTRGRGNMPA